MGWEGTCTRDWGRRKRDQGRLPSGFLLSFLFAPTIWAPCACGCLEQAVPGKDVVGKREPPQYRGDLSGSANGELAKPPLPKVRIDALMQAASPVDFLALRAVHALAPSGDAGAIVGTRRIRVGLVLAVHR